MNELIKVTQNDNDEQLVSGRGLHEFLEIKTPYKKWFDRMIEYGFIENVDFITVGQKCPIANGGFQERNDHFMKLDMAKELSMIQRTEKGKQARQYFIQIEKAWNTPEMVMARALQQANKSILCYKEQIQSLELKIEEDKPKVELADLLLEEDKYFDFEKASKMINIKGWGRNTLFKKFREAGYLDSHNKPYQRYVDAGYFKVVPTTKKYPDGNIICKTLMSGKVIEKIIKKFRKSIDI